MTTTIGPYFNTYLYTNVYLHPSQMDNDIYKHLKNNLIKKVENKCYLNYGFISKVYKIEERTGGRIMPEDPTSSATYDIKFSCKLCRPIVGSTIVCEVEGINKTIVCLKNGPIIMILSESNINMQNFMYDEKRNAWLAIMKNNKGIPIVKGSYVKAIVSAIRIEEKTNKILTLGTLEQIATTEESELLIAAREKDYGEYVDYNKYVNGELSDSEKKEHDKNSSVSEEETNSEVSSESEDGGNDN